MSCEDQNKQNLSVRSRSKHQEEDEASSYLLLAQDEDPPCFDGVPGGQVLPGTPLHSILVDLPGAIPRGPGHTHVVPFPVRRGDGEGGGLSRGVRGHDEVRNCSSTHKHSTAEVISWLSSGIDQLPTESPSDNPSCHW